MCIEMNIAAIRMQLWGLLLSLLLMVPTAALCDAQSQTAPPSKEQSRTGKLDADSRAYLELDLAKRTINVRIQKVLLREIPFELVSDSETVAAFAQSWLSDGSAERSVVGAHLLRAADVLSETEMKLIAEEMMVDVSRVQRFRPARMVLLTNDGFVLRAESDSPDARAYRWRQFKDWLRRFWGLLAGWETLDIRLSTEDAMALYGVAETHPAMVLK